MNRDGMVTRLDGQAEWDVIVIGGGATGLGAAVEAASRGYTTLLLEAHDFAKGTSSRSTKLIHGGVRYLKQGNVSLVLEALHERGLLIQNAPHLVHHLSFVVPVYDWWEGPFYGIGLKMYDVLAGKLGLAPSERLSREQTLELIPTVEPDGLRGGVMYYDGQFDDARLAVTLARTTVDLGGVVLNYMPVTGLLKTDGLVSGVVARDLESGIDHELSARVVINSTGVFSDAVRRMDDPEAVSILAASQGVHVVLDRAFLPGNTAIMIPATDDGRVLFAVPWHSHVVVGTTDTPVDVIDLEPRALEEEIEFLLRTAARYLTRDPRRSDVESVFAGLRPLVSVGADDPGQTASISREHTVVVSASGLVTIAGGKWTTYRKMGADVIDEAAPVGGLELRASETESLRLHGWTETGVGDPWGVYGSEAAEVRALSESRPGYEAVLHERLPYRAGQVVWAARYEMARTVEDVLARRTRALFLDARAAMEAAPAVAALLAEELDRDGRWQNEQVATFRQLATGYVLD